MKYLVLILSLLLSSAAVAKEVKEAPAAKVQANSEDIQKIEKYLNDIGTLTAPFIQEDSEGGMAEGTFYLSRPGRLRWDYAPPTPILIVAKGSLVAYYDKELDEVSHVSLDDTLAGFLTRQKISFGDDGVKIIGFEKNNGEIRVTIAQNKKEDQGSLKMVFKDSNLDLIRLEVTDSIGKNTIVRFSTLVYNKPIDKELFVLPRVKTKLRS